jgi:acetolactate synthase-1/2/3 large subunit
MMIDERLGQRTVAEALAEALAAMGVTRAFGVSGGAISLFWTALAAGGIAVTHFRHESGAGFAACEASIITGEPVLVSAPRCTRERRRSGSC